MEFLSSRDVTALGRLGFYIYSSLLPVLKEDGIASFKQQAVMIVLITMIIMLIIISTYGRPLPDLPRCHRLSGWRMPPWLAWSPETTCLKWGWDRGIMGLDIGDRTRCSPCFWKRPRTSPDGWCARGTARSCSAAKVTREILDALLMAGWRPATLHPRRNQEGSSVHKPEKP